MPRGYRGAIYAIGLIVLALLSGGTAYWLISEANQLQRIYQQEAKAEADRYTSNADIAAESRCLSLPPQAQRQCQAEESDATRQGRRDEYDLEAQRTMAVWTRYMGIAAIIGMAVGIFGVGLIFVTFRETRRAATSAQKTHDAFVAVERPRLIARARDCYYEPDKRRVIVRIEAENIGKSTAYVQRIMWEQMPNHAMPGRLHQQTEAALAIHTLATQTVAALESAEAFDRCPYVVGYIQYRSAFGMDHRSHFVARIHNRARDAYGGGGPYVENERGYGWPEDT